MLLCPLALDYFLIFTLLWARGGAGGLDTECKESGMGREILTHSVMQQGMENVSPRRNVWSRI